MPPLNSGVTDCAAVAVAGDDAGDVRAVAERVGDRRIAGDEADVGDDLVRQRRVRRDAGVDDRDADALAGDAGNRADAEQAAGDAGAHLIGGGRLVRDRHADAGPAGRRTDDRYAASAADASSSALLAATTAPSPAAAAPARDACVASAASAAASPCTITRVRADVCRATWPSRSSERWARSLARRRRERRGRKWRSGRRRRRLCLIVIRRH